MRKKTAVVLLALAAFAAVAGPANANTTSTIATSGPGMVPMWKCGGGC
jgi:hypothetical protein